MATTMKFPGVYPSIRDLSGVVADTTTTACAYVGEAEYGPVLTPTLVSTLQEFTDRFGSLSSRYGYAGYSLAVAAESISEHYFVRVVPTGSASDTDRTKNAKWGDMTVLKSDSTATAAAGTGYFYEEVEAAKTARDAGASSGLFPTTDTDSAFKVVATDPNNRKFYITTKDSTINENKAYAVSGVAFTAGTGTTTVKLTTDAAMAEGLTVGDEIVVSRMGEEKINGNFKVTAIADSETTGKKDISYSVSETVTTSTYENGRIGKYPAKDETTFTVIVAEKVGTVMQTLETFEYCTLYQAQDNYGNSTFIEDVINGTSNYIQVFVNDNLINSNTDTVIVPKFVTEVAISGNRSGTWEDAASKYTYLCSAWELFRDRSQISVSLLMNSGYVLKGNTTYQAKMLEIAEARRDCFCLFDIPMTETEYEDAIDWRKNIQGFNSYRGAISSPWVKTYDAVQGRANFVMCPSAYVAKIIGTTDPWLAPAGLNRGILSSSTVSPTGLTQYYTTTQGGNLYADNQINCVIKNPGSGYVNWGQRTLQAKPSALDRINVARTVIYIETVLRDAARWHLFENNTAYERMQINLQFSAFLDTVLSAEGIQKYSIVCDESNNTAQVIANNQMVIDIYLWPTYTAEVIRLQTTVMGADTTVSVTSA